MEHNPKKPRKWGVLILFASTTTLICCALPIMFVSIGMGSLVAAVYGEHLPWLRWFGMNEHITFGATAALLLGGAWALFRPGRTCPADPELGRLCAQADKWNKRFLALGALVWCVGAFATFVLPWWIS